MTKPLCLLVAVAVTGDAADVVDVAEGWVGVVVGDGEAVGGGGGVDDGCGSVSRWRARS